MATRPDHARAPSTSLDPRQVDALLCTYRVALDELRLWRDPAVAGLIARIESLQGRVAEQRRQLLQP